MFTQTNIIRGKLTLPSIMTYMHMSVKSDLPNGWRGFHFLFLPGQLLSQTCPPGLQPMTSSANEECPTWDSHWLGPETQGGSTTAVLDTHLANRTFIVNLPADLQYKTRLTRKFTM